MFRHVPECSMFRVLSTALAMNRALKDFLSLPPPPGASCSINFIYPMVNVLFIDKNGNKLVNSRVKNFSYIYLGD